MLLRLFVLCITGLALTGCATAPTVVGEKDLAKLSTVGVVSSVGDKLQFSYMGGMAFQNHYSELPAQDWGLDDQIEGILRQRLEHGGQYRVVNLKVDREKLYSLNAGSPDRQTDFSSIREDLRAALSSQSVDAIIVVTKYRSSNRIGGSSHLVGLGVFSSTERSYKTDESKTTGFPSGFSQEENDTFVFASYTITMLNAASLTPIATRPAVMKRMSRGLRGFGPLPELDLPFIGVGLSDHKGDAAKLQHSERKAIEQGLAVLLTNSVPLTLRELGVVRQ